MDVERMYSGTCPRCHEDKSIGHGPLCVDCLDALSQPVTEAYTCDEVARELGLDL